MKKILLIGMGLTLLGYIGCSSVSSPTIKSKQDALTKSSDMTHATTLDSTKIDKTSKLEKKGKTILVNDKQVNNVFEDVDMDEMKEMIAPKKGVEPRGAFRLPKGTIKNLKIGDAITLPEIDGQQYVVNVIRREVNSNQSVTIKASIEGESSRYYSLMTEGEKTSFVTVTLPEGVYEMETVNGNGYVYNANDIRKAWIDPSKTDGVTVPKRITK